MPRATLWILCAALSLAATSCAIFRELGVGGDDPEWQEQAFEGLSRSDAVYVVAAEISRQYKLAKRDDISGEIESYWLRGDIDRQGAKQRRERVLAQVERQDDGGVLVRLRVQRQVADDPGMLLEPEEDDWGPTDDDVLTAQVLMRKIGIVLADFRPEEEEDGELEG